MGRGVLLGILLLGAVLIMSTGQKASAQDYNHTITVYATVAEQRAVYLDASGNVVKVAGNTARNLTPRVYTVDNKLVEMTNSVARQYQDFLNQHGGQLEAGKTYIVNQLAVQTASDNRTIQVDTTSLILGSARTD